MSPAAQPDESVQPAGAATRPEDPFLHVLGRHQLSSVIATVVDYAIMIVTVSVLGLGPVNGTVVGATCGAVTNFTLGRYFTFRRTEAAAHSQLLRYVVVSAGSLGWNALGEHVLAVEIRLQYIVARVLVGVLVGLLWNFPMHRYFVFRH